MDHRTIPLCSLLALILLGSLSSSDAFASESPTGTPPVDAGADSGSVSPTEQGPSAADPTLLVAPEPQPPAPSDFSIIYEGNTGGISGANSDFWVDDVIASVLAGRDGRVWERKASGWGAFLQEGRWLLLAEGGVPAFRDSVASGAIPLLEKQSSAPALVTDDYLVFAYPRRASEGIMAEIAAGLGAEPFRAPPVREEVLLTPHESRGVSTVLVERSETHEALSFPLNPDQWETRLRSHFVVQTDQGPALFSVVSRLQGEGARRVHLASKWRASPSLYLSAGESIEGRSFLADESLSLQRPHTWARWEALGLTALAPGALELAAGLEGLRAEADAAGVSLTSVNLHDDKGQPIFAPYLIRKMADVDVALMGWTDPSVLSRLPASVRSTTNLQGVSAVRKSLAELDKLGDRRPALVVLFGVGAKDIASDLPGVDIVLGDFSTKLRLARWEEIGEEAVRARSLQSPKVRAPALVTRSGGHLLGRVDLAFDPDSGVLRQLRHLRARLTEDQPVNVSAVEAVQSVRQTVYAGLSGILIPELESLPLPPPKKGQTALPEQLDRAAFVRLSANLLLDRTSSDIALLRPLPEPPAVPGETGELYVDASLSVPDEVVVLEMSGAELKALLKTIEPVQPGESPPQTGLLWAWAGGVKKSGLKVQVRGRPLADAETYLVATSDFYTADPKVATVVKKAVAHKEFQGEGWLRYSGRLVKGSRWLLHDLIRDGLSELREAPASSEGEPLWSTDASNYARNLAPLLRDQASERSGRLRLELDNLALQLTGSLPAGDRESYATSSESRVHQAQAMNASARGRSALVWDDRIGTAKTYVEFAFGEQTTPDAEEATELEDDLELGLEGHLRLLEIPTKKSKIQLSSFFQGALDTEFTPAEGAEETQKTLRFTSGTSFGKLAWFRELKTGFFLEYDAVSEQSPVAPGFSVYGKLDKKIGPFKWTAFADLRGYLPTELDGLEDLAMTLQLRTDIALLPLRRFAPGLAVGAFADLFLFQGARPVLADGSRGDHRPPGAHLLVGLALSYDSAFTTPLRLR